MNKKIKFNESKYKEVYDLVDSLNLNCGYVINKKGLYYLKLYPKNFNLYEDRNLSLCCLSLEDLKKEIKLNQGELKLKEFKE